MYTVSKGPSKIVAKTRRGLLQNYEKFETIKESGKRTAPINGATDKLHNPRPVFQRKATQAKQVVEEPITPEHEDLINFISYSWNHISVCNGYDEPSDDVCNGGEENDNPIGCLAGNGCEDSGYASNGCESNGYVSNGHVANGEVLHESTDAVAFNGVAAHGTIMNGRKADANNNHNCTSNGFHSDMWEMNAAKHDRSASHLALKVPSRVVVCDEPPSPALKDFQPFDLEAWWGRRLFNNITKSL